MTATLDYDIKKALPVLTTDNRWNVLTVLILHANIRNRCWVSMDTIAEMATNGNRTKATRAKKWLEQHGAFELVEYDKRVKEEQKLTPRQHVYQLTGVIAPCQDISCRCQQIGASIHYLYQSNRPTVETIDNTNNLNGETFENLNGETFNRPTIETRSISNELYPNEVLPPNPRKRGNKGRASKGDVYTTFEQLPIASTLYDLFSGGVVPAHNQLQAALMDYVKAAQELTARGETAERVKRAYCNMQRFATEQDWTKGFGLFAFMKRYVEMVDKYPNVPAAPAKALDLSEWTADSVWGWSAES